MDFCDTVIVIQATATEHTSKQFCQVPVKKDLSKELGFLNCIFRRILCTLWQIDHCISQWEEYYGFLAYLWPSKYWENYNCPTVKQH